MIGPKNCAVLEQTADGVDVGRCWHFAPDGTCPRHGDVRGVQLRYEKTSRLALERDLPAFQPKVPGHFTWRNNTLFYTLASRCPNCGASRDYGIDRHPTLCRYCDPANYSSGQ